MAQINNRPAPKPRFNFMWFWVVVAIGIIAYAIFGDSKSAPVKGDWQMVEELVEGGSVRRIDVLDNVQMSVYLNKEHVDSLINEERFKAMPRSGAQIVFTSHGDAKLFSEELAAAEAVAVEAW